MALTRSPSRWGLFQEEGVWLAFAPTLTNFRSNAPGRADLSVLYLFAGEPRKGDIRSWLEKESSGCSFHLVEIDVARNASHNVLHDEFWENILEQVRFEQFDLILLSPFCNTYNRASFSNSPGFVPLRNADWPEGFPWLTGRLKDKAGGNGVAAARPRLGCRGQKLEFLGCLSIQNFSAPHPEARLPQSGLGLIRVSSSNRMLSRLSFFINAPLGRLMPSLHGLQAPGRTWAPWVFEGGLNWIAMVATGALCPNLAVMFTPLLGFLEDGAAEASAESQRETVSRLT